MFKSFLVKHVIKIFSFIKHLMLMATLLQTTKTRWILLLTASCVKKKKKNKNKNKKPVFLVFVSVFIF